MEKELRKLEQLNNVDTLFDEIVKFNEFKKSAEESIDRLHEVQGEVRKTGSEILHHLGADTYAERDIV